MYQFYYAKPEKREPKKLSRDVKKEYSVTAIRPAMWEEHCLECGAPLCFTECVNYVSRSDGRCNRFENSISVFDEEKAVNGKGAHIKFRKWANLMTVIFPSLLTPECYGKLDKKNLGLGRLLKGFADSKLPVGVKWQSIRIPEYIRRRSLRKLSGDVSSPDAFILHCFSNNDFSYRMIIEVYEGSESRFKFSLPIEPGENFHIVGKDSLSEECSKAGNVLKIYPENDIEADVEFYWCDFVCGSPIVKKTPADKVKCVVWDLDNTLWDGIFIETEDPDTLKLREGVLETVKALDERGIIQSVASKNDFEYVWPVVERLGISEYFLYPQINWGPKSASIENISKLLNIGVDTFAFIDDSEFEWHEVENALPQVRIYSEKETGLILSLPPFDVIVTEESKKRRLSYRAEEKRNILKNEGSADLSEFLRKCNIKIKLFTPKSEEEVQRSFELVQRTNQLNLSGVKYTKEEFEKVLCREGHVSFAFGCSDDFGDYGTVCFGQYRCDSGVLIFTEFAMSCRVAGKYIESSLFANLLLRENAEKGVFEVRKTEKNTLLRRTLADIGFKAVFEDEKKVTFEFDRELKNSDIVGYKEQ